MNPRKKAAPGAHLRIATYNIHKGISPLYGRNRIHDLRQSLAGLGADIVFLQEVQGRSERHARRFANWPSAAQHDYLAAADWEHTVYGRNVVRADGDHGNALLSRFEVLEAENLDVSHHRLEGRGLLHCTLDVHGRTVHCMCAHFGLFEQSRRHQAGALIERVLAAVPLDQPLLVAGDFNDWRNRLGMRLTHELGLREVFELVPEARRDKPSSVDSPLWSGTAYERVLPARTFPAAFPILRLDRVYVRGFDVVDATVVHGPGWHKLSDHAPIVVDLKLP